MQDRTIVLTMFGKNESVESISISLFDNSGSYYYPKSNAGNYCENINGLELKDNKWVYAGVIDENEKIILKKPFEINITNFEMINDFDDRSIQRVFREVSSTNLAIALKGTNEKTQEKVFKNVSKRIAAIIKEDMELNNNVNDVHIMESRKKIIEVIKQLFRTGEIVLPGGINI